MKRKRAKNRKSRKSTTRTRITRRQNKENNLVNLFARLVDYLLDENNRLKRALNVKNLTRHTGLTFGGTASHHSRTHDK